MSRKDVTDEVREMHSQEDSKQTAVWLDNLLSNYGLRVIQGFNDNFGYYVIEE